jgi:hypothetical protein
MKVAYIFATQRHTVSYVLGRMILPQLEENRHGVDGWYVLLRRQQLCPRARQSARRASAGRGAGEGILLMGCDQCCYEREIADRLFEGVPIGCFPDLYGALAGNMPDQVITL